MILCYDYDLSKKVAIELSDYFSMRFLDEIELFNFDFYPRNLSDMIELNGQEFVISKLKKIAKSECDYEGIIFISHLKIIGMCEEKFADFRDNNFIVYLNLSQDKKDRMFEENKNDVFFVDCEKLKECEISIKENLADIYIDAYNDSTENISLLVAEKIKNFYNIV